MDYFIIKDNGKLRTSEILSECRKLFSVWCFWSDKELDENFPPEKTKAKFRNVQEAYEEFRNMSANDLKEKYPDKKFITLRQRLLLEIKYFNLTKKHLDILNITVCAGSRHQGGNVPSVDWDGYCSKVRVSSYDPVVSGDFLRSRQAVSLESLSLKPKDWV